MALVSTWCAGPPFADNDERRGGTTGGLVVTGIVVLLAMDGGASEGSGSWGSTGREEIPGGGTKGVAGAGLDVGLGAMSVSRGVGITGGGATHVRLGGRGQLTLAAHRALASAEVS